VSDFQLAWLRAVSHACGSTNEPSSERQIAAALAEVEQVRGRVTEQAARVNLASLARRGLIESTGKGTAKRWWVTLAGSAALESSLVISEPSLVPTTPAVSTSTTVKRLASIVLAYDDDDLALVFDTLAPEVILFIPGFSVLAGTHAGRGQVLGVLQRARRYSIPNLEIVEGVDVDGEVRVRVIARAPNAPDEPEEVEIWIRCRMDQRGRIDEIVIQPEDQASFDRAVGRVWPPEMPKE